MLKMIENYSQLANRILDYAIKQENIHQCGEGDIYEINNDPNVKFPIFWMSSTQPVQELDQLEKTFATLSPSPDGKCSSTFWKNICKNSTGFLSISTIDG